MQAFGQTPYLHINGLHLVQSMACLRYLGGRYGFSSDSVEERARMDVIVDGVEDVMRSMVTAFFDKVRRLPSRALRLRGGTRACISPSLYPGDLNCSRAFPMGVYQTNKEEALKKFTSEAWPKWAANLERLLVKNGSGVFVGKKLSYADVALWHIGEKRMTLTLILFDLSVQRLIALSSFP